MGLFHIGVPTWLLNSANGFGNFSTAVETGTFRGDSALSLAESFGSCVTIEREPNLAERARERFVQSGDAIEVITGSSRDLLGEVCRSLNGPAFFWLDGHWSGGETAGEDDPCPLLAELHAINSSALASQHLIAIDDARLFGLPGPDDPNQQVYPSLRTVLQEVERHDRRSFVLDDVVVAVPTDLVEIFLSRVHEQVLRQSTYLFRNWTAITRWDSAKSRMSRITHPWWHIRSKRRNVTSAKR